MVAAASMLGSSVATAEVEAPSPAQEVIKLTIPPEPEPGFYLFIEECTKKITADCGDIVVRNVVENLETSQKCCGELVNLMGKTCHDDLLRFFVSLPELELNATEVYAKGDEVWNTCVKITEAGY
ncbi:hypothetical protein DITRI_Ditri06bG0013100 [Diplodiscus trichospermus]